MKRYALKGINDDATECSICGKIELKRVMWLVEIGPDGGEIGEPFQCGTSCGAKFLGYTHGKLKTKVTNFETQVTLIRQKMERNHSAYSKAHEFIRKCNDLEIYGKERREHPHYIEATKLFEEAKQWAAEQPVLIEM